LAPGSSCTFLVSFSPTAPGINHGSLVLTDNALNFSPSTTQTISLNGTGTGSAPQAVLNPITLSFGNVTADSTSAAQTVTLSNTGTSALSITGIGITGANPGQYTQTSNCGISLAPGANCNISVAFRPSAAASYSALLSVADNATGSPQTVNLAGTGVAPALPQAVLNPTSLSFGNTNTGSIATAQTIMLSNPGNAALTIGEISVTGANPGQFAQTSNCGTTLTAGTYCTISIIFTPAAVASYTATLAVADNAAGSPQGVQLTGSGVAPPVTTDFSIASLTGAQTVARGASAQYAIMLTPINAVFSSAITLSALGLPAGATAAFSPATVTPNGNPASSNLTMTTSGNTATAVSSQNSGFGNSHVDGLRVSSRSEFCCCHGSRRSVCDGLMPGF
jgi:hypothetical protein